MVAKLLALDPLPVADLTFDSLDDALCAIGRDITAAQLAAALWAHGVDVGLDTVYRWRRELVLDTALPELN